MDPLSSSCALPYSSLLNLSCKYYKELLLTVAVMLKKKYIFSFAQMACLYEQNTELVCFVFHVL